MALHTLSICTGLSGIELGLDVAASGLFRPVLYCERELPVAERLAGLIEAGAIPAAPVWSDVKTLCDAACGDYLREVGVDAIVGGYPCQPFSCAGKRLGKDDPRHLWPWIVDAIDRYQPAVCFFENVAGHVRMGFRTVRRNLEDRGYRVAAGLFSAAEAGAPHKRLRLFILAVADSGAGTIQQAAAGRTDGTVGIAAAGSSGTMADAERPESREGTRQVAPGGQRRDRPAIDGGDVGELPDWPPGPRDAAGWRWVLERWPGLAPALEYADRQNHTEHGHPGRRSEPTTEGQAAQPGIRFVVDELSPRLDFGRVDQLRALGNAVVPATAAMAFISLSAELLT